MQTFAIRTLIAALLAGSPLLGQMFPPRPGDVVADIPFEFSTGAEHAPAGQYLMRIEAGVVLLCEDGVYCRKLIRLAGVATADPVPTMIFTSGVDGFRLAGLSRRAIEPCSDFQAVPTRALQVDRYAGFELARAWR